MGLTDSIKRAIGIEGLDDEDEMITEEEVNAAKEKLASSETRRSSAYAETSLPAKRTPAAPAERPAEKRFGVTNTSAFKLLLIEPESLDECQKLVDCLKSRKPIIVNLEKVETEVAKRIFDFMNGATYALEGSVQKISNSIFIFAPNNVDVTAAQSEKSVLGSMESNMWKR